MGVGAKPKKLKGEAADDSAKADAVEQMAEDQVQSVSGGRKKKRQRQQEADADAEEAVPEAAAAGAKKCNKKQRVAVAEAAVSSKASGGWWAEHGVSVTGIEAKDPALTFQDVGLPKRLLKACVARFDAPTPIQAATWPLLMEGHDLIGIAKTGSGKTLSFALPFLARSEQGLLEAREQPSSEPRMVVLAPTRELVQQIASVCEEFSALASKIAGKYPVCTIVGGLPKRDQCQQIREVGADIVCATTGRLTDLATMDRPAIHLSGVQLLVLDEADRMLDMGFVDDVKKIASLCPAERQTVFFSATWPRAVHRLATSLTREGTTATITVGARKNSSVGDEETGDQEAGGEAAADVNCEGPPTANEMIHQIVEVFQNGRDKLPRLVTLLKEHKQKKILVFALYKKEAATLERNLQQRGFPEALALQGDMTQQARNNVMSAFRDGSCKLLIATDVASRGLDVKDIDLVINFTFPLTIEDFVHRIGRTARGGKSGKAITLFNAGPAEGVQDEKQHAGDLARVLRQAKQNVPDAIERLAGLTSGNKATKKKAHHLYGNFFRDEAQMAKLEAKKVHKTFDDSDDD